MILFNSLESLKTKLGFKISIASPLTIIKWSWRKINNKIIFGQLTEPYTINFKDGTPEINGLFCERIFGPIVSWQCKCGLFNNIEPIKYTYICPLCNFENNTNQIRKYRIGYIYLYTPIVHILYLHTFISYLLNFSNIFLEYLLFYKFILDKNTAFLKKITFSQLIFASNYIQFLLKKLNILNEILKIKTKLNNRKKAKIKNYVKHINLLNLCILNNIQPSWVLLDLLPVLPVSLRPIFKLNNNTFIISPLNEIYKHIILKNNKLKKYQSLRKKFPIFLEVIEKHNLQKYINKLIYSGTNSLSTHLQGKYNYFRQYILGKRVDFSGRTVITSGSSLNINKVGISIVLSIQLFKHNLINLLKKNSYINTLLRSSHYIECSSLILKRLLKFIFNKEIILLNRAPTLHRLNIQTFKPYLIENEIIELFPLACSGFNADFDGDQMGIFLILSNSAKKEAKKNMIFDKNIMSPSKKKNMFKYSQNITLGLNSLLSFKSNYIKNIIFNTIEDAINAYNHSLLKLNTIFFLKINFYYTTFHKSKKYLLTSIGRLLLQKLN